MARSFFSFASAALLAVLVQNVFAVHPSDSYADGDPGQSSYLGGNHNMDPAGMASQIQDPVSLRLTTRDSRRLFAIRLALAGPSYR